MKPISSVRTQLMYKTGAYLVWKSTDGPLIPGLQNGYAVTAFSSEMELRSYTNTFSYSQLIKQCVWKVGTAEITEPRLHRMFNIKRPLAMFDDIWDRYMIPFTDRLSYYASDTKYMEAGKCSFMKDILIRKYVEFGTAAVLMLPLVIGYKGKANHLEQEMSDMISNAGGRVHNNKTEQSMKVRSQPTETYIGMTDKQIDFPLTITMGLSKNGYQVHETIKK